jgi:hypothetical protein
MFAALQIKFSKLEIEKAHVKAPESSLSPFYIINYTSRLADVTQKALSLSFERFAPHKSLATLRIFNVVEAKPKRERRKERDREKPVDGMKFFSHRFLLLSFGPQKYFS